jgi:hypothetical protein
MDDLKKKWPEIIFKLLVILFGTVFGIHEYKSPAQHEMLKSEIVTEVVQSLLKE